MSGWEIHEYGGINSLQFNDNIQVPIIRAPTDVLVEVYTTAVNQFDQLMTGLVFYLIKCDLQFCFFCLNMICILGIFCIISYMFFLFLYSRGLWTTCIKYSSLDNEI